MKAVESMTITNLASGSKANSAVLSFGDTHILLDAGLGSKETYRGLLRNGIRPEQLAAVVLSHSHGDHIAGLCNIVGDLRIPVYLTGATLGAINWDRFIRPTVIQFEPGASFDIRGVRVGTFEVPHDAPCVGFTFDFGGQRLAWATDLGSTPSSVVEAMSGADVIALEFSHDPDMLAVGPYPAALKKRIAGEYGHLDNESACAALKRMAQGTSLVIGIHLSTTANQEELVRLMAADTLSCRFEVAGREGGIS